MRKSVLGIDYVEVAKQSSSPAVQYETEKCI